VNWSLLGCGRFGHATYAPSEPELREFLSAPTPAGLAWRCLRCAAFVPGEPTGAGPAAAAPDVRRDVDLRSAFILRLFAIERFLRALVFGVAAYAVWRFEYARASLEQEFRRELPAVRTLLGQLGYNVDHSKLVGLIQHALTLRSATISLIAAGLAVYAVIEIIEGVGLWLGKRWGEYFAMVVTSLGLPYEIWDLTNKVTVTRVIFLVVNLALVLYLVITKRLFGARGGKAAYEARLRSESVLQAAIDAAAAARVAAAGGPARPGAQPPANPVSPAAPAGRTASDGSAGTGGTAGAAARPPAAVPGQDPGAGPG
jgi:uncharacterized membrane protein (DUF2068 family)